MGRSVDCIPSIFLCDERTESIVAYYNAGSVALVLVIVAVVVGGFLWWRSRRQRMRGFSISAANTEEHIPLNLSMGDMNGHDEDSFRQRKGKERTGERRSPAEELFSVGDSDGDEDARSPKP